MILKLWLRIRDSSSKLNQNAFALITIENLVKQAEKNEWKCIWKSSSGCTHYRHYPVNMRLIVLRYSSLELQKFRWLYEYIVHYFWSISQHIWLCVYVVQFALSYIRVLNVNVMIIGIWKWIGAIWRKKRPHWDFFHLAFYRVHSHHLRFYTSGIDSDVGASYVSVASHFMDQIHRIAK